MNNWNTIHTQKMNEFGLIISDMQRFTKENAELEAENQSIAIPTG